MLKKKLICNLQSSFNDDYKIILGGTKNEIVHSL